MGRFIWLRDWWNFMSKSYEIFIRLNRFSFQMILQSWLESSDIPCRGMMINPVVIVWRTEIWRAKWCKLGEFILRTKRVKFCIIFRNNSWNQSSKRPALRLRHQTYAWLGSRDTRTSSWLCFEKNKYLITQFLEHTTKWVLYITIVHWWCKWWTGRHIYHLRTARKCRKSPETWTMFPTD